MEDYNYKLDIYERLEQQLKLSYEMKEGYTKVQISKDSFPITITNLRSCKNRLQSNTYTKLSRWFIKNKIPIQEREMWPLVFNHENELLYILDVGYEHGVSTDTIECYMLK
jgi:tRNA(Ile)-lysidine synthetase-like protein